MKTPISYLVQELVAAVERKDGYIMGATGQDPKKWAKDSWWFTQYTSKTQHAQALKWREEAAHVWDCNGLAEGIYKQYTGEDINTKARYNYANWCSEKGSGLIPTKKRQSGMAIFWGDTASTIHHVAYLEKPMREGHPEGDWWIIEARGVAYGVVRTKLNSRKPNFWGKMDKYFDYEEKQEVEEKKVAHSELKKGDKGADVLELQNALLGFGLTLPKYGADGEFGNETKTAVKQFQKDKGLPQTGICDEAMWQIIEETISASLKNHCITITGEPLNVRTGPSASYPSIKKVYKGEVYGYTEVSESGWYRIDDGWVCGSYATPVIIEEEEEEA